MRSSKQNAGVGLIVTVLTAAVGVAVLLFGDNWFEQFTGQSIFDVFRTEPRDCSLTTEIGPWSHEVTLNPDRDGWVQADFWLPAGQIVEGYDEVSVIFDPGLRVTIAGASGIAWKYDRTWSERDVERCTENHIVDSLNIRRRKLLMMSPSELCNILQCQ